MPSRKTAILAAMVLALAALLGGLALLRQGAPPGQISSGEALVGGPFAMTGQNGRRVTEKDFLGRYMLVFFGYTSCPDVCPAQLQVMMAALAEMGKAGEQIQPVFVSIDPERDTPKAVKSYVENFGPRLVGLTGSPEDIAAIAKAYRVYYRKVPDKNGEGYAMDHSSIVYLMDPGGKYRKHFTYTTDAKALAEGLAAAIED